MSLAAALVAGDKRLSSWCVWKQASYLLSWCLRLCCDLNNYSSTPNGLWVNSPWVEAEGRMGYWLAYVAWRFCRAGRTSGQAAKFACEARENERRSREKKLLPPQSPRGFSALARLYYLARPTKTAMLRRLATRQNTRHASARGREGSLELYSILWSDWPTSKQKVSRHGNRSAARVKAADVIFRRERNDDRIYVCGSQAKMNICETVMLNCTILC